MSRHNSLLIYFMYTRFIKKQCKYVLALLFMHRDKIFDNPVSVRLNFCLSVQLSLKMRE